MFHASGKEVGTFAVHSLPSPGSLLLLVPHRKNAASEDDGLAFESHTFAPASLSQVALIDTFRGNNADSPHPSVALAEATREHGEWKSSSTEELRFNSVVSLAPGYYHLALPSAGNTS